MSAAAGRNAELLLSKGSLSVEKSGAKSLIKINNTAPFAD